MRSNAAEAPELAGPRPAADPRADQRRLRPGRAIADLGEFLAFLDDFEAVFGATRKPRRLGRGDQFRL